MESSAHVALASAPPGGHPRGGQAAASQGLSSASREARRRPEPSGRLSQPRGSAGQTLARPRGGGRPAGTTDSGLRPHYNPQSAARRCPREAVTQWSRQGKGGGASWPGVMTRSSRPQKGDQGSRPTNLGSLPEAGLRTFLLSNFEFLICLALTGADHCVPSALRPRGRHCRSLSRAARDSPHVSVADLNF